MASLPEWNSFGRINASQRWRKQSAVMGRAATDAIVAEAQIEPGLTVLDVASGTGEPAISIAVKLAGTGQVLATDITAESLEIARLRARERNLRNIEFHIADVHHLQFPDASFDRVTCRLGVMFFSDLPQALREIHRVLRPGGRVSLLAWGSMEQPYFQTTIGTVVRVVPGLAIPASGARMCRFGETGTLRMALSDAGFAHITESLENVPWTWTGSPKELWEYFQAVTAPFKPLLEAIPADRQREVDTTVLHALEQYVENGSVQLCADFVLASAHR